MRAGDSAGVLPRAAARAAPPRAPLGAERPERESGNTSRAGKGVPDGSFSRTFPAFCFMGTFDSAFRKQEHYPRKIAHAHIRTASEALFPFLLLNSHFRSSRFSRSLKEGNCLYRASVDWQDRAGLLQPRSRKEIEIERKQKQKQKQKGNRKEIERKYKQKQKGNRNTNRKRKQKQK